MPTLRRCRTRSRTRDVSRPGRSRRAARCSAVVRGRRSWLKCRSDIPPGRWRLMAKSAPGPPRQSCRYGVNALRGGSVLEQPRRCSSWATRSPSSSSSSRRARPAFASAASIASSRRSPRRVTSLRIVPSVSRTAVRTWSRSTPSRRASSSASSSAASTPSRPSPHRRAGARRATWRCLGAHSASLPGAAARRGVTGSTAGGRAGGSSGAAGGARRPGRVAAARAGASRAGSATAAAGRATA